jgi:hypothetical protein
LDSDPTQDSHLFDIVEPLHPCSGGITIEDVQRRLAQQVNELHLDERFRSGRDALGASLATGQKKVSTAFNNLWADIEEMRETQRRKAEEQKKEQKKWAVSSDEYNKDNLSSKGSNIVAAQQAASAAGSRASAYLSAWGTWASEKRKSGWGRSPPEDPKTPSPQVSPAAPAFPKLGDS